MCVCKCEVCTLANEALDIERQRGGLGWLSPAMAIIKKYLDDQYEVSVVVRVVVSTVWSK